MPKITNEDIIDVQQAYEELDSEQKVADLLGISKSGVNRRLKAGRSRAATVSGIDFPEIADKTVSRRDMVDTMITRFNQFTEHEDSKKWMPFKVKDDGPIAINWFGDPHVDDNGCNWPQLDADLKIVADTPHMYGANIGDSHNNWVGRLMKLYGDQDTSRETARELVKYLLEDAGVDWLIWIMGNHDIWNDGVALQKAMGAHIVPMHEWQAQFRLVFPNKREVRIWACHNFPGNSMWNTLHSAQKSAHMKDWAHLYIQGHTHNWALHQEESASRGFIYWLARARGYKYYDDHAEKMGHFPQKYGASIVSVINPKAETDVGLIHCFADVGEGAEYLKWLRR